MRDARGDLPAFRAVNDKRLRAPHLVVDAIDIGLLGQVKPEHCLAENAMVWDNGSLWHGLLSSRYQHGDTINLVDWQLLEWLPASPGRYFTKEAAEGRLRATLYIDTTRGEYLPLGKEEMILGGVGSVRLAPRSVRGGDVCFFCATSNGVSHQGIPVIVPLDEGKKILREIKQSGGWAGSISGTLWPLPIERSPIQFDRDVPKYYLFAEDLAAEPRARARRLVTVAITYGSTYGESHGTERVSNITINPNKNWSFASFDPSEGAAALKTSVDWLKRYAARYSEGVPELVSIVGDFDENQKHFDNPIEFPLASIMSGQYDARVLDFYGRVLHLTINKEVIMGDKFENIQQATIINRSTVQDAVKTLRTSGDDDVSRVLASVAAAVEASGNVGAGALLNNFTQELNSPTPDKSALRQCWDALTKVLPDIAAIAGAGASISKLFS